MSTIIVSFLLKFYNNVDCSDFTYDTPPSPIILEAVEKAKQRLNATEGDILKRIIKMLLLD